MLKNQYQNLEAVFIINITLIQFMSQDSSNKKKVKIPNNYIGDSKAIKQQLHQALEKTMASIQSNSKFHGNPQEKEKFYKAIKNNLTRFTHAVMNTYSMHVERYQQVEPEENKVYLNPDLNIERNNEVRLELLKQGAHKLKNLKVQRLSIEIQIDRNPDFHVVYDNGFSQPLSQAKRNLLKKTCIFPEQIEKLNFLRSIVSKSSINLQKQLQIDYRESFETLRNI